MRKLKPILLFALAAAALIPLIAAQQATISAEPKASIQPVSDTYR